MPSEQTQFTRDQFTAVRGTTKRVASSKQTPPIAFRPYEEDLEALTSLTDRATFIRDAVHAALQRLNQGS